MPYRVPTALDLSEAERAELQGWSRRRKTAQALALGHGSCCGRPRG